MFGPVKIMEGLGLPEGEQWPSEAHGRVAACALGFNEQVNELDDLRKYVNVLLGYSETEIKLVTIESLRDKGLPV